jgi:hypothetical protein
VFAAPELVRSLKPYHVRVFLRVACAAVLVAVLTQTRADPDLFGHVRFALFSWTLSERYTLSVIGRRRSR